MKRIMMTILSVMLLIILCSCGNEHSGDPIGTEDVAVTTGGSPETNAPETDPPATTATVTTTAPGTTTSPAPSTTVPVTTAPITTAPPATTVPATTQDLSPTRPYNSVLAKYPEPIEKVPITSVNGIDNEEAIKLISALIQHDYYIYHNISVLGHLPYDETKIISDGNMRYAKVISEQFKSVKDIKDYIALVQGYSFDTSSKTEQFRKYYAHIIEYMYFDKTDELYIDLSEIRQGMQDIEKWDSFSWTLSKVTTEDNSKVYHITVDAVLHKTKEVKSYSYKVLNKKGTYVCRSLDTTFDYGTVNVSEDIRKAMFYLAEQVDNWHIENFMNSIKALCKAEQETDQQGNILRYKVNSDNYKTIADLVKYFSDIFPNDIAVEFVNMWFYEENNALYTRRWWNGPYGGGSTYVPESVEITYLDSERCEFVIVSKYASAPDDSKYREKHYCTAVFDGKWKLKRYYGLADVSHSAVKDVYSLGERLDDQ